MHHSTVGLTELLRSGAGMYSHLLQCFISRLSLEIIKAANKVIKNKTWKLKLKTSSMKKESTSQKNRMDKCHLKRQHPRKAIEKDILTTCQKSG